MKDKRHGQVVFKGKVLAMLCTAPCAVISAQLNAFYAIYIEKETEMAVFYRAWRFHFEFQS